MTLRRFGFRISVGIIAFLTTASLLASAGEKQVPVYEKINQYRKIKTNVLLWGPIQEVFVRVKADKAAAYPGEAVTLTYDLLSRVESEYLRMEKAETLGDFAKVEYPSAALREPVRRSLFFKDRQYQKQTIRKLQIYAASPGEKRILPGSVQAFYKTAKDPAPVDMVLTTEEALKINVKEFPETGRPEGFSGLAGRFRAKAGVDLTGYAEQGTLQFFWEISGDGDLGRLEAPEVVWPEGIQVKSLDSKVEPFFADRGCNLRKTFTWALIPAADGAYEIPSIAVSFFDPKLQKYRRTFSAPVSFEVVKNPSPAETSSDSQAQPAPVEETEEGVVSEKTGEAVTPEKAAQAEEAPIPPGLDKEIKGLKEEIEKGTPELPGAGTQAPSELVPVPAAVSNPAAPVKAASRKSESTQSLASADQDSPLSPPDPGSDPAVTPA